MSYFLIDTMAHASRDFCFLEDAPAGTEDLSYRMAKGFAMGNDYPANAKVQMAASEPGKQLSSILGNTNGFLYLEKSLVEIVQAANLGEVEFLPVTILDHKGRPASTDYFVVNPLGTCDCLDLEASEIEWFEGDIVEIDEYVLAAAKLAELPDLFRVQESPRKYVVRGQLAERLLAAEATNLKLDPLRVSS